MVILFLGDVAGTEILLILFFVLIFFGPKSIPGLAKTMGKTMRQIKDASDEIKSEITKGASDATKDIRKDFDLSKIIKESTQDIEKPFRETAQQITKDLDPDSSPNSMYDLRPPVDFTAPLPMEEDEAPIVVPPVDTNSDLSSQAEANKEEVNKEE